MYIPIKKHKENIQKATNVMQPCKFHFITLDIGAFNPRRSIRIIIVVLITKKPPMNKCLHSLWPSICPTIFSPTLNIPWPEAIYSVSVQIMPMYDQQGNSMQCTFHHLFHIAPLWMPMIPFPPNIIVELAEPDYSIINHKYHLGRWGREESQMWSFLMTPIFHWKIFIEFC